MGNRIPPPGFSIKVPDRHLKLVVCAEREPTAENAAPQVATDAQASDDSLPSSPGRAMSDHMASRSADLTPVGDDPLLQAFLNADRRLLRTLGIEIR